MGKLSKEAAAPPPVPFNTPFAALAGVRAVAATAPAIARVEPRPSPDPGPQVGPARAVVRLERKGRGGRTVTVVEQLALPPVRLEEWASALKSTLGCGGAVEGDAIVVQGEARERVARWLAEQGVRKVVRG